MWHIKPNAELIFHKQINILSKYFIIKTVRNKEKITKENRHNQFRVQSLQKHIAEVSVLQNIWTQFYPCSWNLVQQIPLTHWFQWNLHFMGLREKEANTRTEFKVGRWVEKVGEKKPQESENMHKKINKFKNTTKPTWVTGQLLSSIPNKTTQATYNENTKKNQRIQFGTSLVCGIKRWDSSLQVLCSDNVVHSTRALSCKTRSW